MINRNDVERMPRFTLNGLFLFLTISCILLVHASLQLREADVYTPKTGFKFVGLINGSWFAAAMFYYRRYGSRALWYAYIAASITLAVFALITALSETF